MIEVLGFRCDRIIIEQSMDNGIFLAAHNITDMGIKKIFDQIGKQKAMEYWGLVEKEEISRMRDLEDRTKAAIQREDSNADGE